MESILISIPYKVFHKLDFQFRTTLGAASKIMAPICYGSVDTEQIDGYNDA